MAAGLIGRLIRDGWIADYAHEDGHARVLGRLARRLEGRFGRTVPLQQAASLLEREWEAFDADFREFQPALEAELGDRTA